MAEEKNDEIYMGTLEPYFEISQNEYNRERDRKQSLETRSGIVITVITALFAYLIKEVDVKILLLDIQKDSYFVIFISSYTRNRFLYIFTFWSLVFI